MVETRLLFMPGRCYDLSLQNVIDGRHGSGQLGQQRKAIHVIIAPG